jgi:import receptor subunit TOM20
LKLKETEDKSGHHLVADDDFAEDAILYTETPLISALHPQLEVKCCFFKKKKKEKEKKKKEMPRIFNIMVRQVIAISA